MSCIVKQTQQKYANNEHNRSTLMFYESIALLFFNIIPKFNCEILNFTSEINGSLSETLYRFINIIIIVIIIIKTSSKGPSGKNTIVYKLLSQPHKHLSHGKLKKSTTQGSNQRLTAPLNPSNVLVPNTV